MQLKQVGGKTILYVMAAEPEYGPHLRQRIDPLMTGIGPVEAAVVLASTLEALRLRRWFARPCGIAWLSGVRSSHSNGNLSGVTCFLPRHGCFASWF